MKIIACVDNKMGLMFNKRRQSQDRIVREKIKEMNEVIYMNNYSYQLYKDILDQVVICDDFLDAKHHYCLIENISIQQYSHLIDEIILFRWNRDYPADFYLDIELSHYKLIYTEDFEGSSHQVTLEIYRKD